MISIYKEQGGVERGFRILKDPLGLLNLCQKARARDCVEFRDGACLLVYRLAEHLLRSQLAATEQTVPNQVNKPTNLPTMRWIFKCFEGSGLLRITSGSHRQMQVLGL